MILEKTCQKDLFDQHSKITLYVLPKTKNPKTAVAINVQYTYCSIDVITDSSDCAVNQQSIYLLVPYVSINWAQLIGDNELTVNYIIGAE